MPQRKVFVATRILALDFELFIGDLGLNRLGLGVFAFNEVAIKCYTRAGFVCEGNLRQVVKVGNSYWNCSLMGILRREWKF